MGGEKVSGEQDNVHLLVAMVLSSGDLATSPRAALEVPAPSHPAPASTFSIGARREALHNS